MTGEGVTPFTRRGVFCCRIINFSYKLLWINKDPRKGMKMVEKRKNHRRHYIPKTRFPLHTQAGDLVTAERRQLPTRRVNDIEVKEISCLDYISELH